MKLAAALVIVLALAAGGLVRADDQATRAADPAPSAPGSNGAPVAPPPTIDPAVAPAEIPTPTPARSAIWATVVAWQLCQSRECRSEVRSNRLDLRDGLVGVQYPCP